MKNIAEAARRFIDDSFEPDGFTLLSHKQKFLKLGIGSNVMDSKEVDEKELRDLIFLWRIDVDGGEPRMQWLPEALLQELRTSENFRLVYFLGRGALGTARFTEASLILKFAERVLEGMGAEGALYSAAEER